MENLIFTQLSIPEIRKLFRQELQSYFKLNKIPDTPLQTKEQYLFAPQAAKFLGITLPTLYSKVSRGELPYMKRGKRLHFSRTELMDYIKAGRRLTNEEIEAKAHTFIKKKGGKNG